MFIRKVSVAGEPAVGHADAPQRLQPPASFARLEDAEMPQAEIILQHMRQPGEGLFQAPVLLERAFQAVGEQHQIHAMPGTGDHVVLIGFG